MRPYLLASFFILASFTFSQTIQWQQLSGPHGGAIYSIVTDNSGNIYANTVWGAGSFKSTDDGESWFSIQGDLTPYNGEFHPLNINSNGDLFIGGAHNTAMLCRSTDSGITWEPLHNLNTNGGSVVCISFDNSSNVYVGTGQGIFKSSDNGDNWLLYGMSGSSIESIAFNSSGDVFAGNSAAVFRSTDDGANWTQLPTGGGTRTVSVAPNGYIFAGCWGSGGILRSTNNGNTWEYSYPQTVSVYSASTVFFDINDDIYFPTWGGGILKSTNNGDTWTELNNGLGNKYIRAVAKNINGYLITGTTYGVYEFESSNESWYSVGLQVCGVREIAISSNDYIFAGVWGVNRSLDLGQSWQTVNNGLINLEIRALVVKDNGYLFTGTNDSPSGTIFRSTNNGENWVRVDNFPSGIAINGLTVGPIGEILATGSGYNTVCHISTDDGATWQDIRYGINFGPGKAAINSSGDIFITGGSQGIWRKMSMDTVWTQVLPLNGAYVLFIASNGDIYTDWNKSTDNGQTWISNGLNTFVSSYTENSKGHLFAGTYNFGEGVYRSTDFGGTWEQINDGLTILDIRSLAMDSEDYLYAGSWGKSMFKTTTSTLVSFDDLKFEPVTFYLKQNFPNPFNPSTNIKYAISSRQFVTLKVYDVLGNEIKTLVNEEKPVGSYEVEFDAAGLPSGVYFYQLRAGEFIQTKKMLLLK